MRLVAFVVVIVAACAIADAQPAASHQQELQRLRQSIESTRRRIQDLSRRESSAMRSLSSTQRQQKNLQKIIAGLYSRLSMLEDSVQSISSQIERTRTSISNAENRWKVLTRHMQERNVAQRGRTPASLLPAYLYAQATRSTAEFRDQLSTMADSLSERMEYLDDVSQVQATALREQQQRRDVLTKEASRKAREIETVRSNKQQLITELRKKEQSAAKIRSLIEQLVAKERTRKRQTSSDARAGNTRSKKGTVETRESTVAKSAPQRGAFQSNSLPWPTSGRNVLHGYGTYTNPTTGTSHENPGIDIKAPTGTGVSCVAKGVVSTITWLPGFGSLVIVDHQNGFRTVYANLAAVAVQRGAQVLQGARIGTSGSNLDGDLVHFEVWIEGKRINPLTYLR